jgi:signal transduction histidine kinase
VAFAPRVRVRAVAAVGGGAIVAALILRTIDGAWTAGGAGWMMFAVLPLYAVGSFVAARRPEHPQAWRMLLVGVSFGVGVGLEAWVHHLYPDRRPGEGFWLLNLVYDLTGVVGLVALAGLIALFPSGHAEERWTGNLVRAMWLLLVVPPLQLVVGERIVIGAWSPVAGAVVESPMSVSSLSPLGPVVNWVAATSYAVVFFGPILLLWRYRRASAEERMLMRGLIGVVALSIVALSMVTALVELGGGPTAVTDAVVVVVSILSVLALSLTFVVGILRYHLFDIDLVLRKSVVFVALWCLITGVYVALALAPGLALGERVSVPVAVTLTVVVAVVFQPVRSRLERLADRLVSGRRVNHYELVRSFGTTLEMSSDLDVLMPRLAGAVRDGIGAAWVRVSLRGEDIQREPVDRSWVVGSPVEGPELVQELRRGDQVLGRLECGPRHGGYTSGDAELLATLAGQAAPAISNLRLAAQLAERLVELERSRARIYTAQDLERRRIERDLHDGAQQEIVAILAKLGLARSQVERGEQPGAVLRELQGDVLELLAELRELAHGIHPPVLSDRGLVAAVEARADRLSVPVTVSADDICRTRRLSDDIEGAAYFVVCEALTNVVKHSFATTTEVTFASVDDLLRIEVRDNGRGFCENGRGSGLANMRDRVEALGGSFTINGDAGAGTRLSADLPMTLTGAL